MKKYILILIAPAFSLFSFSQCIDESLINPDIMCPAVWAPVCGCDGVTYSNSCVAQSQGGVTTWTDGECIAVIECNDLTGIDFGDCTMPLGIGYQNGQCVSISGCGYVVDNIDYSAFFFLDEGSCIASCGSEPQCQDLQGIDFGMCDMWLGYALVNGQCSGLSGCGYIVNEIDYNPYFFEDESACIAACGSEPQCLDLEGIDFGMCEMWLGYALVNGQCSGLSGCGYTVNEIDYNPYFFEDESSCIAACGSEPQCLDLEGIDFGMCDMWLGYALVNGQCSGLSGCGYTVNEIDYNPYFFDDESSCIAACGSAIDSCFDIAGIDFGLCNMWLGYAINNGTCMGTGGCGYIVDNVDYTNAFYPTLSECFLACGSEQNCINDWQLEMGELVDCTGDYTPVCGCDGVTYANTCVAFYSGGVVTYSNGPCQKGQSNCQAIPAAISFGACEALIGWGFTENGCQEISGCGYIGQNGYNYSGYFFGSEYECVNSCIVPIKIDCIDETQIDLEVQCPTIYQPVCGCDSVTYSNPCIAQYHHGVTTWIMGECITASVQNNTKNDLLIYPNPVNSILNIRMEKAFTGVVSIYDLTGKTILQKTTNTTSVFSLDMESLASGIYLIECRGSDGNILRKQLVKE